MKKREFEKRIKELNLERIYYRGRMVQDPSKSFFEDSDENGIYGCYLDGEKYVIFFKDTERAIIKVIGTYDTEDEAYDKLLETISLWAKNNK